MWLGFQWSLDHINVHSHTSLLRNLENEKTKPSRTFDSARPELRIAQSENQTQIVRSYFDVQKFWAVLNSWELFPTSHWFRLGCTLTLIVSKAIDTPCKRPYPAFRHSLCESEREPKYLNTNVYIYMYTYTETYRRSGIYRHIHTCIDMYIFSNRHKVAIRCGLAMAEWIQENVPTC